MSTIIQQQQEEELQWISTYDLIIEAIDIYLNDYISNLSIVELLAAYEAYTNNKGYNIAISLINGEIKKLTLRQTKHMFDANFREICLKRIALYELGSFDFSTPIEEIEKAFAFLAILQEEFIKFIKNELKIN